MPRISLSKLTASALAAGALLPAAALAADISLDERPTLIPQSKHRATVTFSTDKPLPRRDGGGIKATVRFDGGSYSVGTSDQEDFTYFSWVKTKKTLKPGQAYKVRIAIDGEEPIVRTLRVK
jgi:hypothetical protein